MPIGFIFEWFRQRGKSRQIKDSIIELQRIADAEVIDLVKPQNKIQAKILLKQAEHYQKSKSSLDRQELSKIEKEIILLMEDNIKNKKEELAKKNATQLDVAKILKTIQKLSNETADEISNLSSEVKMNEAKLNSTQRIFSEEVNNKLQEYNVSQNLYQAKMKAEMSNLLQKIDSQNLKIENLISNQEKSNKKITFLISSLILLVASFIIYNFIKNG